MIQTQIAQNIACVRERIARAAQRARRSPDSVTLVAVTKTVAQERIAEAYAAGVRDFGESYVQEALPKLNAPIGGSEARWHFIGHLQSNKAREVVGRFVLIQSVDSLSLAKELGRRALQAGQTADILLEVKLDPRDTKFGFTPESVLEIADETEEIPGVRLRGLMGIAPYAVGVEETRSCFRRLSGLFQQLPPESRQTLSMGMSGDFEIAIEEGATLVRIGTAIFGPRT